MKSKFNFLALILIFAFGGVAVYGSTVDSLQNVLLSQKEDTNKVVTLNLLSRELINQGNFDEASKYLTEGLSVAQKINFKKGEASIYLSIGLIAEIKGEYPEAVKNFTLAMNIGKSIANNRLIAISSEEIGNTNNLSGNYSEALKNYMTALKIWEQEKNETGMANEYNNIGVIYRVQGNLPEALNSQLEALKIRENTLDKRGMGLSYINIGDIYLDQRNNQAAIKYFNNALKIFENINDRQNIAGALINLGDIYLEENKLDDALKYLEVALTISEDIGDQQSAAHCNSNIGTILFHEGKYEEAQKKFEDSKATAEAIGDQEGLAVYSIGMGNLLTATKKYDQARKHLDEALRLSKELGSKEYIKESYQSLMELDSAVGDFKQAFIEYKLFQLYEDSLVNEENFRKITQTSMQYEFDKKVAATKAKQDKKDVITQKENEQQKLISKTFMGAFGAVFLFSIVFYIQRNRVRKEKKRSDELLLNILPSETAEELKLNGTAKARGFDEVTVLFTDFKNFSIMSEKLNAQELVNEINFCYVAFDNIMTKYGIEKIKTIGDSYMCASGLPVVNKSSVVDIVHAALEIRDFMSDELNKRKNSDRTFFEVRIGLNTGPVVAGIVGVKKFAYDIWGDTVNLASRMESSGEAGKINISGSTYELIKDKFVCTPRGKIEAKNKGEVEMYFVERSLSEV